MRKRVEHNLTEKEKERIERMREIHNKLVENWGLTESFDSWFVRTEELQEQSWNEFVDYWFGVLMLLLVSCGVSQGLLGTPIHGLTPVVIYILEGVIIE